jgi:DNA-binding response OmpR family regulator
VGTTDDINAGVVTGKIRALAAEVPLNVLLVDDDELERALIRGRLESRGIDVREAPDGAQALARMKEKPSPVVIVDWQMPLVDGLEFTEKCRALKHVDTYIIMLTARSEDVDYERGLNAGVDDYLTKDVRDAELLARIHAGFNTYSLRQALRDTRAALALATSRQRAGA